MFSRLFRKDKTRDAATELYRDVITQARSEVFYTDGGVPDTVDGRFDLITLHMFFLLHRLRGEKDKTAALSQALFDVMFKDMDASLREMGVGDLIVGKRVRKLAEDFYGRINAYERALAEDEGALAAALRRNILVADGDDEHAVQHSERLAEYATAALNALDSQKVDRMMLGYVSFPEAAQFLDGEGEAA